MFSVEPALAPDGTLTFTPAPDENGIATITVHAVDNGGSLNGGSDSGPGVPFTITVQPVNDPPTCANVGMATSQGAALTGQLTCADVDGDTIHYHKLSGPSHGSATVNDDGTFSYQPVPSFVNAADMITFRVDDGVVTSNTATLTINVEPDPTAHNDLASVIQGTGPNAIDVLANDVDRDPGDSLKIVSVSQGSRGRVAITGSGTGLSYDPTALVTGTDSFTYTIQDTTARASQAVVFVTIVRDTLKPVAAIPIASIVSPSALGSTTLSARISWSATDVGSGVKSYQLQESVSGSLFHSVALSRASARSVVRMLSRSRTYRYRVRAVDVVGNVGGWAVGPTFGFGRYQETAGSITYAGSWRLHSSSSYFGGKVRASTAAGATATFTFTGRAVAWVAAKGPTRGVARVYVDGVIVSSVNLRSSTSAYRRVVFGRAWPSAGTHTVMVQVAGTAGHPRVDVDAFIVIR